MPGRGWNFGEAVRESDLRIVTSREQATSSTYHDIGAVFYMTLHVPWLVVDSDVARYRERLYGLHKRIQREGACTTRSYAYLIEAENP